jgi:NUMOD3 motif
MSEAHKGQGLGKKLSLETRQKLSDTKRAKNGKSPKTLSPYVYKVS